MKSLRWVVLLAAVAAFGVVAKADTDPAIGVKGGGGSPGVFTINAPDPIFQFDIFGGAAGGWTSIGQEQDFDFINATGFDATELDLLITPISGAVLTYVCGDSSTYFLSCNVTPESGGGALIQYTMPGVAGDGFFAGIPNAPDVSCDGPHSCSTGTPGADFAISVTDVAGDLVNLDSSQGFHVQGTLVAPVPEPASIVLISTGLASLGLIKRRRSKKSNASNSLS